MLSTEKSDKNKTKTYRLPLTLMNIPVRKNKVYGALVLTLRNDRKSNK